MRQNAKWVLRAAAALVLECGATSSHDGLDPIAMLVSMLLEPHISGVSRVVIDVGARDCSEFVKHAVQDDSLLVLAFEPTPSHVEEHRRNCVDGYLRNCVDAKLGNCVHPRLILFPFAVLSGPSRMARLFMTHAFGGNCNTMVPKTGTALEETKKLFQSINARHATATATS